MYDVHVSGLSDCEDGVCRTCMHCMSERLSMSAFLLTARLLHLVPHIVCVLCLGAVLCCMNLMSCTRSAALCKSVTILHV